MSTILTFPDHIVPDSIDWRLVYVTQAYVSPFGSTTQTAEVPGAKWAARLTYNNLQVDEQRELSAFLLSLRGMSGRFTLYDFSLPTPQLGTTLPGTYALESVTDRTRVEVDDASGLTVGDYIEVTPTPGGLGYANSYKELKMITNIDGDFLDIEPPFRVLPSATDPVVFDKAKCVMMLDTDDQGGWSASTSIYLSNMTISCMEAF